MNTQDLKFLTVAAVVALGLGLVGCGSSSSGGGTQMSDTQMSDTQMSETGGVTESEPTAEELKEAYETAKMRLKAAQEAVSVAQAVLDSATDDAARREAQAAVGTAASAVTAAQADAQAAMEAWKDGDPTGYALMQAEMKIAELEAAEAARQKAIADAEAEKQRKAAEAEEEKMQADAAAGDLAARVTQIDADEDMMVTPVLDSSGGLDGIMVGSDGVDMTSRTQHEEDIAVIGGADFGARFQNDGIEVSHAGAFVPMFTPTGFKHATIGGDEVPIVEALDLTDFDETDGERLPAGTKIDSVPVEPRFETRSGTDHADIEGGFDTDNNSGNADELLFKRVAVDEDGDGEVDKDGLGQPIYDYYILTLTDSDADASGDQSLYLKLDLVEVDGTDPEHAKRSSDFEFLAYGAWADVDDDGNYTGIGDGYLYGEVGDYTPAANLPKTGKATYEGQYVGYLERNRGRTNNVEAADGDMTAVANFSRDSMTVTLMDHVGVNGDIELSGKISENMFSGTGSDFEGDSGYIDDDGATAELTGRFFGDKAQEVGGVYEIIGGQNRTPGRIVGAFGAANVD